MFRFIVSDVKIPISILGAEIDHSSPPERLKQFGKKLSEKSEVYPKKKSFIDSLFMILNFINVNVLFQFKSFFFFLKVICHHRIFPAFNKAWVKILEFLS